MDDIIFKTELLKGAKGDRGDAGEADSIPVDGVIVYEGETIPDGFEETDAPEAITDIISDIEDMKTATASGESLALAPTSEGKALIHTAYGMSVQNGTPTPSSPVNIVSAKADFRCVGKNLIPYPYSNTTRTINGVTFTDNGDGTVSVQTDANGATANTQHVMQTRASGLIFLKAGKYKLSGCPSGGSGTGYILQAANTNISPNISAVDIGNGANIQITRDAPVGVFINIAKNTVITNPITFKPMICLADVTDSAFESYKKTDITTDLTLRAIEVSSTDDYNLVRDNKYYIADTLDYSEDNGFVVTRRVGVFAINSDALGSMVFNNQSKWVSWTDTNHPFVASAQSNVAAHLLVNRFVVMSRNELNHDNAYDIDGVATVTGVLAIACPSANLQSKSDWETWLTNNPTTIFGILKTPTTETITTEQALALLSLKTYDESTSISSQAEPSCTVAVEYAKERLAALTLTAYNLAKGNDLRIADLE